MKNYIFIIISLIYAFLFLIGGIILRLNEKVYTFVFIVFSFIFLFIIFSIGTLRVIEGQHKTLKKIFTFFLELVIFLFLFFTVYYVYLEKKETIDLYEGNLYYSKYCDIYTKCYYDFTNLIYRSTKLSTIHKFLNDEESVNEKLYYENIENTLYLREFESGVLFRVVKVCDVNLEDMKVIIYKESKTVVQNVGSLDVKKDAMFIALTPYLGFIVSNNDLYRFNEDIYKIDVNSKYKIVDPPFFEEGKLYLDVLEKNKNVRLVSYNYGGSWEVV